MKKILILTALAIMIAGVFVPLTVCAEQRPWNVDVVLHCGDRSYRYDLSGHIERLSATSRENRGVYMSLRVKKQICDQLCDSGFTRRQALCYVLPDFEKVLEQKVLDLNPTENECDFYKLLLSSDLKKQLFLKRHSEIKETR